MELTLFYKGPFLPFLSPYSGCSFLRCTLLEVLAPGSSTSSNGFLTVGLVSSRYHPLHLHTGGLGLGTATHLICTQKAWGWAQLPTSPIHRRPGAGHSYPPHLYTEGLVLGTATHITYTQEGWGWAQLPTSPIHRRPGAGSRAGAGAGAGAGLSYLPTSSVHRRPGAGVHRSTSSVHRRPGAGAGHNRKCGHSRMFSLPVLLQDWDFCPGLGLFLSSLSQQVGLIHLTLLIAYGYHVLGLGFYPN